MLPRAIDGETSSDVPCVFGSGTKTALGAESGIAVSVTKGMICPVAELVQPAGSAGAVTESKLSLKTTIEGLNAFSACALTGAERSQMTEEPNPSNPVKIMTNNLG